MTVAAVICLVIGVFFVGASIIGLINFTSKEQWPKEKIIEANVNISSGPAVNRGSETRTQGFQWVLSVEYLYEYEGKTYSGHNLSNTEKSKITHISDNYTPDLKPPKEMLEIHDAISNSEISTVYVNPKSPESSFIYYNSNRTGLVMFMIFGLMFLVPGLVLVFKNH